MVGDILGIRPLLHVVDGEVAAYAKVRGEKQGAGGDGAVPREHSRPDDTIYLPLPRRATRGSRALIASACVARGRRPSSCSTGKVGAVVGTHTGPGTSAFGMIVE